MAAALVAAGTLAAAGLVARSDARDVPRLYFPPDAAFGIAVPDTSTGASWSFGSITLCLTKPGKVTITRLTPLGGFGRGVRGCRNPAGRS